MALTQELEYEISGGSLYYVIEGNRKTATVTEGGDGCPDRAYIVITRMQGLAGEVEIPETIKGIPVTAIGRKAFLSRKNLRKVTLPSCLAEVGDWAFAYCDSLHTVRFENSKEGEALCMPEFGKSVFLECSSLRRLYVGDGEEGTAALLAAAVTTAGAPYLLDAREAGSTEWLEKWDARMFTVLRTADNEGYSRQVLCGEEDYGSTDLVAYESGQRRIKVRLLLLRLLYPIGLSELHRQELEDYLRKHTKGCEHEETWQVILEEHGEDRDFYQLFAGLGCINSDNFEALLLDVGEEYPELRAYLMRYKEEQLGYHDFFAGLEL